MSTKTAIKVFHLLWYNDELVEHLRLSKIMGILQQTKYLLRKNYHIKKRNKRETLQEILIPIWWILLLLLIKLGVRTKELPAVKDSEIPTFNISTLGLTNPSQGNVSSKPTIGYIINGVPNASPVMELVKNASKDVVNYVEFNSTDSMLDYYRKNSESKGLQVGIEFAKGTKQGLAYTIRVPVANMPSTKDKVVGKV